MEDLEEKLKKKLIEDRQREHYQKEQWIDDLWVEEKAYLLAFADQPYPVFKETAIKFNKYNEFLLDGYLVHVPKAKNHVHLRCLKEWNCFKVISHEGGILLEDYRPYMKKRRFLPWNDILKGWLEKPRSIHYSRYFSYLPGRISEYLSVPSIELRSELRRSRVNNLLSLLVQHDIKKINDDFYDLTLQEDQEDASHPYEVNWTEYDALQPSGKEEKAHE
ncbi:Transposase [Bacillus badius]|uniref:Transposase n=1 Tax=Bacillus badius TaxID=1455 RepID=A0ABR5APR8_BACBA|nr:Transposase [Bacillus badius]